MLIATDGLHAPACNSSAALSTFLSNANKWWGVKVHVWLKENVMLSNLIKYLPFCLSYFLNVLLLIYNYKAILQKNTGIVSNSSVDMVQNSVCIFLLL